VNHNSSGGGNPPQSDTPQQNMQNVQFPMHMSGASASQNANELLQVQQ
jgi:hypothetical protein